MKKRALPFCCLFLLLSCATYGPVFLSLDQIAPIHRGMTRQELLDVAAFSAINERDMEIEGQNYRVVSYLMQTSMRSTRVCHTVTRYVNQCNSHIGVNGQWQQNCHRVPHQEFVCDNQWDPVGERYYFLFKEDRLLYWGYLDEYLKSEKALYSALGEKIKTADQPNK